MTWIIKKSGTHISAKLSAPLARILNSIRVPQPMKGTHNPVHLQVNLPKSIKGCVK